MPNMRTVIQQPVNRRTTMRCAVLALLTSVIFGEIIGGYFGEVGRSSRLGPCDHGVVIACKTQETLLDKWIGLSGDLTYLPRSLSIKIIVHPGSPMTNPMDYKDDLVLFM
jgi:hypothetical protein